MQDFFMQSEYGCIHCFQWMPACEPVGIVQIIHGIYILCRIIGRKVCQYEIADIDNFILVSVARNTVILSWEKITRAMANP